MKKILVALLFVFSLFAGESEERGVPFIKGGRIVGVPYVKSGTGRIDSAVLAPNGESFYTLKQGLLTQWMLSPLKKLKEWELPMQKLKEHLHGDLYITNNKILIVSPEEFVLFNLQTQKVEKTLTYNSTSRVQEGNLLYFSHLAKRNNPYPESLYIEVWDINNLSKVRDALVSEDLWLNSLYDELWLNHQNLYYFAHRGGVLIVDKKSLHVNEHIDLNAFSLPLDSGSFLTNDGKFVIGKNVYRQSDNALLKNFPVVKDKDRTPEDNKDIENLKQSIDRYFPSNNQHQRRATQVGNLKLAYKYGLSPYAFYRTSSNELMAYIFQDEGELVLINQDGYFQSSTEHPAFLTMLDETRKPIPINDATFKKYNQPLNIKAN